MAARVLVGPKKPLIKIDKGFGEYFWEKAEKFGDSILQTNVLSGEQQTYKQVLQRSTRVATGLKNLGVEPKDIVMLCCYNDLDVLVPWIATLFLGGVVCSLHTEMNKSDIDAVTKLVKPKILFVVEGMLETIQDSLQKADSNPEIIVIGKSDLYQQMSAFEEIESTEEKTFKPHKTDPYETSFIILTSGTTSIPKGICLNQHRFMDKALQNEKRLPMSLILRSSMYWITDVLMTYQIVASGGTSYVAQKLTPLQYLETLSKYQIDSAILTGSTYSFTELLENSSQSFDLSSLKMLLVGGAKVDKSLILKLRKLLPKTIVFNGYGSTEIGTVSMSLSLLQDPKLHARPDSIGKACDNVEIKIVDNETGKLQPPNQEGELLVKTPFLMTEYYNDQSPDIFDSENFFKTGDLAYYDDEEFIFITDRVDQTFTISLENRLFKVSPSIVETQLLQHQDIEEGAVFGIQDEKHVKVPAALVVLKDGAKPNIEDIIKFVNDKVPNTHKLLGGIKVVDALPKTTTDKIARRQCVKVFCCKE